MIRRHALSSTLRSAPPVGRHAVLLSTVQFPASTTPADPQDSTSLDPEPSTNSSSHLSAQVRTIMRLVPHPLTIILATPLPSSSSSTPGPPPQPNEPTGLLVSSFNTVTLTPDPYVSFNIKLPSATHAAILASGTFTASGINKSWLARKFLLPAGEEKSNALREVCQIGLSAKSETIESGKKADECTSMDSTRIDSENIEGTTVEEVEMGKANLEPTNPSAALLPSPEPPPTAPLLNPTTLGPLWWMHCAFVPSLSTLVGDHAILVGRVLSTGKYPSRDERKLIMYINGWYRDFWTPVGKGTQDTWVGEEGLGGLKKEREKLKKAIQPEKPEKPEKVEKTEKAVEKNGDASKSELKTTTPLLIKGKGPDAEGLTDIVPSTNKTRLLNTASISALVFMAGYRVRALCRDFTMGVWMGAERGAEGGGKRW